MLRFVGYGDQKKIHQKSPPFSNVKFPGKYEKNIHKIFLERRQSNNWEGQYGRHFRLSGPLNRLNAILSLLQSLDRYRSHSATGSADWEAPISHPRTGRSSQPPRSKPLRGLNRAIVTDSGAIEESLFCCKAFRCLAGPSRRRTSTLNTKDLPPLPTPSEV